MLTFRLPTETEWETACRAGASESEDYCKLADGTQITASTLSKVARYGKGWDAGTVSVGSFLPNAWGLYDMHGNVWEWTDTADGDDRVIRGGGFGNTAEGRVARYRNRFYPDYSLRDLGLRLAASGRTAASTKEPEAAVRVSDGKQAARSVAASRSETVGASSSSEPCVLDLGGGVTLEMVQCPGVAPDFWMGKYEVTQEQWERVMGKNPSEFKGLKKPVETVSWNDCRVFVEKLNARSDMKLAGLRFAIPTEAQWEYACRAGSRGNGTM